ncbi:MAG: HAMP domain-containing histidine kinase [Bacteroidales bacterium]|nr:HAMP domain-containing histidine kinase [Bacteroidales bacterium]
MKYFLQTRTWKLALFVIAALFILGYVFAVYTIISKISENERRQVQAWASTVQKKADMVNYTEQYFKKVREEEFRNVNILVSAFNYLGKAGLNDISNSFYFEVIGSNENIPVIWVDGNDNISGSNNVDFFDMDTVKKFTGAVKERFSQYEPIEIRPFKNLVQYLYYTDSKLYSELYDVLDEMNRSFFDETAGNIAAVPVIITDSTRQRIYITGNIPPNNNKYIDDSTYLANTLKRMKSQNAPIEVKLPEQGIRYVYYMHSETLVLMRLFPIVQFLILMVLIILSYVVFSVARNAEQNRVWAGMAKETAHQLGTPISSMIAWTELLKMQEKGEEIALELEKDISRLHIIADRFSKIGSAPAMDYIDLIPLIEETLSYLKKRISSQVVVNFHHPDHPVSTFANAQLFSWVIENITRNAVDAMSGTGTYTIDVKEDGKNIIIDFTDSGKGVPKNMHRRIFQPGFTTKKRGWGLGLTLVKRILRDSKGKIFVKNSTVGSGSTFRIVLKKCD